MKGIFSLDSKLMVFLTKVADLMIVNILFLICCIPVFTIGASMTAMYRFLINFANKEGIYPVKTFFKAFRSNFKQSTLTFLILLIPTVLVGYEFALYMTGSVETTLATSVIFLLPTVLLTMLLSYVYPLIAQFENTLMGTIKNAVLMALLNLPRTIVIVILNLLPLILLFFALKFFLQAVVLWLFIAFALTGLADTYLMLPVFKKFYPKDEEGKPIIPEQDLT